MFTQSACLKEYSDNFIGEIKNELSFYYTADEIENFFKLIRCFGEKRFLYDALVAFYKLHIDDYKHIADIKETVKTLYKFGVLGNVKTEQTNNSSKSPYPKYTWAYREDGNDEPDFTIQFVVHNALRKTLNL